MNCDHCNNPAVVHEVTVKDGVKREMHLCEAHAKELGITMPGPQPLNQLLTQFVISQSSPKGKGKGKGSGRAVAAACATCGLTFARFRQKGLVGCPDCYETFEKHLAPLIERAQNGATSHVGKAPRRAGSSIDRQLQIQHLLRELNDAVAAEQYERAATLRDRLETLKEEPSAQRE